MLKKFTASITEVFTTTRWVLGTYRKIAPKHILIYFSTQAILRLESIIYAYFFGVILDKIILAANSGSANIVDFVPIAITLGLIRFLFSILNAISRTSGRLIQLIDNFGLRTILYERMRDLGIATLENSEVANKSQRFMETIGHINNHLGIFVRIFGYAVSLVAAAGVVLISAPSVLPIFILAGIISWIIDQRYIRKLWNLNLHSTEMRRKAMASASMLADSEPLKELLATDGFHFLHKKFHGFVSWYVGEVNKIRKNWLGMQIFGSGVELIAYCVGLLYVFQKLLARTISVGQLTFEFRSLAIFSESLSSTALEFVALRESSIRLNDALGLFTLYHPDEDGQNILGNKTSPPVISYKSVTFSYPNSKKAVIKNLDLKIEPGEKIAIVGENGAGKTTLVKLLLRLYRPSTGEILLNEQNINNTKINSWYKNVGVLFQDFNTYGHLTVGENVAIGNPDKGFSEEKVIRALKLADAYDFVDKYPHKLDQILGEKFKGGIRPSTGQWQKIAIARFFYRDSPVLILDEPTASIDAVAEAQIFDNIYKFIKEKTVIIISHRFSTVRNADRIIVLDKGRIIEEGTHEALLKKKGKYAHAFNLQAKGYE